MRIFPLFFILHLLIQVGVEASELPGILPLRERAAVRDRWLRIRLDTVVPKLMRREGIDMWVLAAREYNEDPVLRTMLPAEWFAARRRTILLFYDPGEGQPVESISVSRYPVGGFFKSVWDKKKQPDQWKRLAEIIQQRNPRLIALNRSSVFGLADGLSASEYELFLEALPGTYQSRIVSAERLAIGWLETRIPDEMQVYPTLCRIAHDIIAEGLSESAITPGVTRTSDLSWWYREKVAELKLDTWFQPSVSIQRPSAGREGDFADRPEVQTILQGDLIHIDFGITYLGLNTDTQQHAYVLKPGETEAPEGLRKALQIGNRLQDILMEEFKTGRTGNEILRSALDRAESEGITPSIYTHPLGYHGHAAGPTIGLWDQQEGVPGKGDYPLYPKTVHSIELNVTAEIPEWNGRNIRIMLEEDAYFDGESCRFIDGRQTRFHLIPRVRQQAPAATVFPGKMRF